MTINRLIRDTGCVALLLALAGCSSGDGAQPVSGTVAWSGGSLSGHMVEVASTSDPNVRGFGTIGADGRFTLERLVAGKTASGLQAGSYQARLILNDEGDGQTKKPNVPSRYLDFKTSGWSVQVPTSGDVALTVAAK